MDNTKGRTVIDKDPHKEAKFATWYFHQEFASQELGAMQFYEEYLNVSDRERCERALKEILSCRDKLSDEM